MPRLLQKSILMTNVIAVAAGLTSLGCMFLFNQAEIHFFILINLVLVIFCSPENSADLFLYYLPDYMFIAPFSKEQREKLIIKGLVLKQIFLNMWMILLIIVPIAAIECLRGNIANLVLCGVEVIIAASLIYSNAFLKFIAQLNMGRMVCIVIGRLLLIALFAGCLDFSRMSGNGRNIEILLLLVCVVFLVGICINCKVKYEKIMISCMADYEYVKKFKTKKNDNQEMPN